MIQTLSNYIGIQLEQIEQRLDQLVPLKQGHHQEIFQAARHALLGGGKRLRPLLTLATSEMFGVDSKYALDAACAIEMIHTYSMIHDDLPCMDNDDYRRGRLTVHRQFNDGIAVLAGDYLLTYAFEILANITQLDAEKKIKLISILSHQSGSEGMIGGQVMDLHFEGKKLSLETLRSLHAHKTAALLTAALKFGGIIADANHQELDSLTCFGENLGLAFQIIDDILDVTSSQIKHGRTISSDILNDKSTYVTLLGLDTAKQYAQECHQQAINALKKLPYDISLLIQLSDFVLNRQE